MFWNKLQPFVLSLTIIPQLAFLLSPMEHAQLFYLPFLSKMADSPSALWIKSETSKEILSHTHTNFPQHQLFLKTPSDPNVSLNLYQCIKQ